MIEVAVIALAALWGAIWWRLRGGALTTMTGFDPGTGGMRAIAAVGMAEPLAWFGWVWLAMIPALWIAWSVAGWGSYQGMGHETIIATKNPLTTLIERAGVRSEVWIDLIGMAVSGLLVMGILAAVVELIAHTGWWLALAGLAFAPLYLAAQWSPWLPDLGRFSRAGSEWGEVLVGAWVAGLLMLAIFP